LSFSHGEGQGWPIRNFSLVDVEGGLQRNLLDSGYLAEFLQMIVSDQWKSPLFGRKLPEHSDQLVGVHSG